MRHCMIVHNYYPHDETRVERQAESLVRAGHSVTVVCLGQGDEPRTAMAAGVAVHRLPIRRDKRRGALGQFFEYFAFMALAGVKVTQLHRQARFDTVQAHNLPDMLVFAALVPRLTGSHILLDLHDLMPEFYAARFQATMDSWPVRLVGLQEKLACRAAHHVITVTELWRQQLAARGVPAEKSSVVMNVADTRYFYPARPSPLESSNATRIIYHGTLPRRYGPDLLVRAFAQAHARFPALRLTIQGRGEMFEPLKALITSLHLDDAVTLQSDFLTTDALAALVREHHIGIVPYRRDVFTDGILPTKLMEYAALGMPAVVARTPGISAYFDDSMVEFFEPEDVDSLAQHLCALHTDRERCRTLARNIQRFNAKYNWTAQGNNYVQLVTRLGARMPDTAHAPAPLPVEPHDSVQGEF